MIYMGDMIRRNDFTERKYATLGPDLMRLLSLNPATTSHHALSPSCDLT